MEGERKKITIMTTGMAPNEIKDIEEAIGGGDSDEIEMSQGVDTEIEMGEESENNPINFNVSMPDEKLPDVDILNMQRISEDIQGDGADELDDILKKKSSDLDSEDIMTLRLFILRNGSSDDKNKLVLAKSKVEEKMKQQREETNGKLKEMEQEFTKNKELQEEFGFGDEGDIDNLDDLYDEEDEEDIKIEKEKLKELKKQYPLNVWDLIDTYFRDNKYYKSKHQLDSFDEFISSETNGIEYIIISY